MFKAQCYFHHAENVRGENKTKGHKKGERCESVYTTKDLETIFCDKHAWLLQMHKDHTAYVGGDKTIPHERIFPLLPAADPRLTAAKIAAQTAAKTAKATKKRKRSFTDSEMRKDAKRLATKTAAVDLSLAQRLAALNDPTLAPGGSFLDNVANDTTVNIDDSDDDDDGGDDAIAL